MQKSIRVVDEKKGEVLDQQDNADEHIIRFLIIMHVISIRLSSIY